MYAAILQLMLSMVDGALSADEREATIFLVRTGERHQRRAMHCSCGLV